MAVVEAVQEAACPLRATSSSGLHHKERPCMAVVGTSYHLGAFLAYQDIPWAFLGAFLEAVVELLGHAESQMR